MNHMFSFQLIVLFLFTCTGPTNIIHKSHSKDAISMWPDMHSFYKIHTFEPIVIFLFSLRNVDHVLRFTNFTVSNCSSFYIFHKFGPILARICEFCKTSNQKLITWVILVRQNLHEPIIVVRIIVHVAFLRTSGGGKLMHEKSTRDYAARVRVRKNLE